MSKIEYRVVSNIVGTSFNDVQLADKLAAAAEEGFHIQKFSVISTQHCVLGVAVLSKITD